MKYAILYDQNASISSYQEGVSEEKIFLTLANQKKELFLAAMFIGQMERNA
jgi:hypothetical protein